MYNRYTPTADGSYRRQSVSQTPVQKPHAQQMPVQEPPVHNEKKGHPHIKRQSAHREKKPLLPDLDSGEILVLLILVLLLKEGGEDSMTVLLAAGIYLFAK